MTIETTDSSAASKGTGYKSLFSNRQFMQLWIAQVFSQFADRAVFVLFVAVLTERNFDTVAGYHVSGAAQLTSLLYVAFTIPAVVLSPVAGVYVDRWSNRSVLVFSNLARAAFVGLIAVPLITKSPMATFLLAFMISIGSQFFGPAETSSIPRLVKQDELYAANSLFFTTMMIALGFGFAVGEPIIDSTGIGGAPYAVAGGFLIAALLVLPIKDDKRKVESREAWWEDLRFGLAYIANNKAVFRAIAKITLLFSTIITLNIIAVGLAEQVMHLKASQFGYIIAAAGLGMGIGNFWVGHSARHIDPPLLAYAGFCGLGFFMCCLASLGLMQDFLFPHIGMTDVTFSGFLMTIPLLFAVLIGISCACVAVPTQAALQAAVPEELRGKVFAAQNTAMSAASTIPVILTGVSADNLPGGVSTTLVIIGLPTLIAGLHNFNQTRRELKGSH